MITKEEIEVLLQRMLNDDEFRQKIVLLTKICETGYLKTLCKWDEKISKFFD